MNASIYSSNLVIVLGTLTMLVMTAIAAPMEPDEQSENALVARPDDAADLSVPWEALNTAALRKLLLQLDADDSFAMAPRIGRSWPQAESRGWGLAAGRAMDGRIARQWRADKRQVRFRQCYFNPISCFRK